MKKNRHILMTSVIIVTLLFSSLGCSNMVDDIAYSTLTVNIDTSLFEDGTLYKVTPSQSGRATQFNTKSTTTSSLLITPIHVGVWDLEVEAELDGETVAEGFTSITVTGGATSTEPIVLTQVASRLSDLSFGPLFTQLDFNSRTFNYPNLKTDYGVSRIEITSFPSTITVTVDGVIVDTNSIELEVDEKKTINIVVKEPSKNSQVYTFTVTREEPKVGGRGPSGGYIFYDDNIGFDFDRNGKIEITEKNLMTTGKRFLEAAPEGWFNTDVDPRLKWGLPGAVAECNLLSLVNFDITYDDWFLPSKDRLLAMYYNLYKKGLGGFSEGGYWSSTDKSSALLTAYYQIFNENTIQTNSNSKDVEFMVRPIRDF